MMSPTVADRPQALAEPPAVHRWQRSEWLLLLLAPFVAWFAFGIVLINQDGFVDPWFYLGWGRAFTALHSAFGWPYYAVRFPVVMLNSLFLSGEHPLIGYAVLRYLLLLACGVPLYAWARAAYGRGAATIGYLFLVCNPLLPRILLWDLTTFVSVPMALAGMAVWLRSGSPGSRFLSGALMTAAVASHAFTGTAVATFLAVQLVRRLRAREIRGLVTHDVLVTGAGAAACAVAGCLYYYARVEAFDPRLIVTVTMSVIGAGDTYAAAHRTPFSAWAAREYHVYVPLLCVVLSGVLLGRRLLQNTAVSSVWWFAAAYAGVYLVYQFVLGRFVLETFYYFAHLSVIVFLLVPVIAGELIRAGAQRPALAGGVGLATLSWLPLMNHLAPGFGDGLARTGYDNLGTLAWLVVAALLLIGGARLLARRPATGAVALAAFLLIAQAFTLLSPPHRRVFDSRHRAREAGVYLAAAQALDVFAAATKSSTQVMLWYCPTQFSVNSIASTMLLYSVGYAHSRDVCELTLGEYEQQQLARRPQHLLLLNEDPDAFEIQEAALRGAGYEVETRLSRTIGNEAYQASLRLVELRRDVP